MAKWTIQRESEKVIEEIESQLKATTLSKQDQQDLLAEAVFDFADELEELKKKKKQTPADKKIILILSLTLARLDFKNYNNFKYPDLWFGQPENELKEEIIRAKRKNLETFSKDELIEKLARLEVDYGIIARSFDSLANIKEVFQNHFWQHEIPYTARTYKISKGKSNNEHQSKMQNKARETLREMEKIKPLTIKDMINFKKKMRSGDKDLRNTTLERYLKNFIRYGDVIKPHHI